MKVLYLFFCLILLISCKVKPMVQNTGNASMKIHSFNWLIGDWQRVGEKEGNQTYESWVKENDDLYLGLGYTLENKDTIWKENVRLFQKDDKWDYEVRGTHDEGATAFRLTEIEHNRFVCENKLNDFPKVIVYERIGPNIKAVISDGDMEIPFEFVPRIR